MSRSKKLTPENTGLPHEKIRQKVQAAVNDGKISGNEVIDIGVLGNCKYLLKPEKVIRVVYNQMVSLSERKRFARLHNRLCQTLMPQNEIFEICMAMLVEEWIDEEVVMPNDIFWQLLQAAQKELSLNQATNFVDMAIAKFKEMRLLSDEQIKVLQASSRYKVNQFLGAVTGKRDITSDVFDEVMRRPDYFLHIWEQVLYKLSLTPEKQEKFEFNSKEAEEFSKQQYRNKPPLKSNGNTYREILQHTMMFIRGSSRLDRMGGAYRNAMRTLWKEALPKETPYNPDTQESIKRIMKTLKLKGYI